MSTHGNDRDDEVLDRLAAGIEPADADEMALRAPYLRLLERIRRLDRHEPRPGWERRVDDRLRRERSRDTHRRWALAVAGLSVAATLAALLLLWPSGSASSPAGLQVAIARPAGPATRGDAVLGATLNITLDDPAPQVELRVYRDGILILRCPSERSPGHVRVDLRLSDAGVYRIVGFTSARSIPPPGPDGFDADSLAASSSGTSMAWSKTLIVTP